MKKISILFGTGALILGLGFFVYSSFRESGEVVALPQSPLLENSQIETRPVFTYPIVDPATISFITPLGELNGGYEEVQTLAGVMMNFKREAVAGNKEIEVRAPTDMTLESYSFHKVPFPPGGNWTIIFRLSQDVMMRIDHISRASDAIQEVTTTIPKDGSAEDYPKKKLSIKAGDIIGYTYGTVPAHNWNIYVFDEKQKNSFINPSRYTVDHVGRRLTQAVCPFDFYSGDLKNTYLSLMGYSKAGQSNTCGTVSHDVKGAASGLWYLSSRGTPEERDGTYASPLSIIKNSAGEITIDQVMDRRVDLPTNNPTAKDPALIPDEHCYQIMEQGKSGYVFVRIVKENEMSLAVASQGNCPSQFPLNNAKTYYR